ncbi:WD40 repeat-like protein [Rhizopogon salebrosus TDB-379]|nr:WD40 repeat-like protein [Rhizopogon salebrosus TDB-379]
MASTSKQPSVAVSKITLEPMMTLEGHEYDVQSMHYFPDGKRMISGSDDGTTREWDMQTGKEIEEARNVCEWGVKAVAVSRDGRWVITAGGDHDPGELKACEVETGIVKTFNGHSQWISCIDICADSTLFASGESENCTTRIWSLDTGKLVAGPFESADWVGAVRLSRDSKKLVVNGEFGMCLEVWNVQTQKLGKRIGEWLRPGCSITFAPVFWTNKETILAVFSFITEDPAGTIYEFDASTLETVGAPFEGHTDVVSGLALSFDGALVASASEDDTIKLWAFESRQLLSSFHVQLLYLSPLIVSPDSGQLTYASGSNIYICKIPPDILTSLGSAITGQPEETGATPRHLLDSEATRHPRAPSRNPALSPVISCAPTQQRPLPTTRDPQRHAFLRHLRKFLRFSSLTDAALVLNEQPHDPLDPHSFLLHRSYNPSTLLRRRPRLMDIHIPIVTRTLDARQRRPLT